MIRQTKPVYSVEELRDMTHNYDLKKVVFKTRSNLNQALEFERAYVLGAYALFPFHEELSDLFADKKKSLLERKESASKRSLAALCALHNRATYKHEMAAEQIAGICSAVFDYDIGLSENGFFTPNVPYAIDNCGMGGDILPTPNISTDALLIAAASGIPTLKHGSPSNADEASCGSSDFVAQMVLDKENFESLIGIEKSRMEECVEKFKFGYIEATDPSYKSIHSQTHNYADLPHMNDIIGPITNPLDPALATKKIIGVNQLIEPKVVAEAYRIMNQRGVTKLEEGLFIRGFVHANREGENGDDGMDELSTLAGGTCVARLRGDEVDEYVLFASDFGLSLGSYEEIRPDERGKGQFSLDILKGEIRGAPREIVLANAAIIENLVNGTGLKDAYLKMEEVLDSGAVFENIEGIREFLA